MPRLYYRLLSLFLCITILLGLSAPMVCGAREKPLAVLWSGSDMQGSIMTLEALVQSVQRAGHTQVDEALFLGDYANDFIAEESTAGTVTLRNILYNAWGLDFDRIFTVQGNHDVEGTENLDPTGSYEREHYSVYHINFLDMLHYERPAVIRQAEVLRDYLRQKADQQYRKPIFVINHMPLHHSARGDARYTQYLVDVLNEGGKNGLDIFFLFGHNHSHSYDHYMGGNCIYYAPGSEILVTDPMDETKYTSQTLSFTYMNPGYVGYTYLPGTAGSTCTVFEIYEDRVELIRYGVDGVRNLKDAGFPDEEWGRDWALDTWEIPSPGIRKYKTLRAAWEREDLAANRQRLPLGHTAVLNLELSGSKDYITQWTSSNEGVAKVEGDIDPSRGVLLGVGDGTAKITAEIRSKENPEDCAKVHLSVTVGFDSEYKTGIFSEGDGLYYYKNGKRQYNAGLIQLNGHYYYIRSDARAATGEYWVTIHNGLLPEGEYIFRQDGKMVRDGRVPDRILALELMPFLQYHWKKAVSLVPELPAVSNPRFRWADPR